MKQNQLLFRPFPGEKPETHKSHQLCLNSKCVCPPCQSRTDVFLPDIQIDQDLNYLKSIKGESFVKFLDQLNLNSSKALPNLPILDTVVFNNDGSIKYVFNSESGKLRVFKLNSPLKNFLFDRKYQWDLEYQKKKYQRQHLGFSFTQLDHTSEKLIKQFENNIKYTNPLLNRIAIIKNRNSNQLNVMTSHEMANLFGKIQRKIFDFRETQYLQVFPIMYAEEQNSYVKCVKFFHQRQCKKKNFKTAEQYVGNWISHNDTIAELQQKFINQLKVNEDELLMYLTYKLFIFFQQVSNKQVKCALLSFITNDNGFTFYLKNIQNLQLINLHQVEQRSQQLPKKLAESPTKPLALRSQMKGVFEQFQKNFFRLQRERKQMQEKQRKDIEFSNQVYESLGNTIHPKKKTKSFINSIWTRPQDQSNQIQMSQEFQKK